MNRPLIMSVDDEPSILTIVHRFLTKHGLDVVTAENGRRAFQILADRRPDLILLDILLPEMNGYEICARLQENQDLSLIPVIFLSALGQDQDRAKALSYGAVDFLTKPFDEADLVKAVRRHLQTGLQWRETFAQEEIREKRLAEFFRFQESLFDERRVGPEARMKFSHLLPSQIYSLAAPLDMPEPEIAQAIARFCKLEYRSALDPAAIELGLIPTVFCRRHLVAPIKAQGPAPAFVISNPFHNGVMEALGRFAEKDGVKILITEPDNIAALYR
jgi:DNA-binding response OmpR family regulator